MLETLRLILSGIGSDTYVFANTVERIKVFKMIADFLRAGKTLSHQHLPPDAQEEVVKLLRLPPDLLTHLLQHSPQQGYAQVARN